MRLDALLDGVAVLELRGDPAVEVSGVGFHTAAVGPGSLFCCLRGRHRDGHDLVDRAVEAGAVAVLTERTVDAGVTQVVVGDTRSAMAPVAAAFHGHPSRALTVVGVTGTNGKTTTMLLLEAVLGAAGRPAGVVGTVTGERTTPEAPDLQGALAGFVAEGRVAAVVEVSSMGLVQHRVDAVRFAAAVFTNLSAEHLDDHGTMERYFEAKASLFVPERSALAVVNADDEHGRRLIDRASVPTVGYSMADVSDLVLEVGRSRFRWGGVEITLPLGGAHNVANAVAAATCARQLGVAGTDIAAGLAGLVPLAGRAEFVHAGQDFGVVVDYAHTPRALEVVLTEARRVAGDGGRVVVVFGCGGDRDPTKRGPMGRVASALADVAVVTSDNPRSEDPAAIIAAVVDGAGGPARLVVEPDRRRAIAVALAEARPGDVVVVAGKGHETGQVVGGRVLPFDDREVARSLLGAGGGAGQ